MKTVEKTHNQALYLERIKRRASRGSYIEEGEEIVDVGGRRLKLLPDFSKTVHQFLLGSHWSGFLNSKSQSQIKSWKKKKKKKIRWGKGAKGGKRSRARVSLPTMEEGRRAERIRRISDLRLFATRRPSCYRWHNRFPLQSAGRRVKWRMATTPFYSPFAQRRAGGLRVCQIFIKINWQIFYFIHCFILFHKDNEFFCVFQKKS